MTEVPDGTIRFWHFQCPECGMGDQEFGHRAETHQIYCEVCLADHGRTVILRRWPADETELSGRQPPSATVTVPAKRCPPAGQALRDRGAIGQSRLQG